MLYEVSGFLQNYAWGVRGGLAPWYAGHDAGSDEPQAELWFGAHRNGPSPLVAEPGRDLSQVVGAGEVPLLVKLLAAARPLSLQVHPSADAAAGAFAAQQRDSALPALLADPFEKDEMLIAVRPFSVFCGWRDRALAAALLRGVGGPAAEAAALLETGDVDGAVRRLLEITGAQMAEIGPGVPAAAAAASLLPPGVEALATVAREYPGDPGLLVAALLDQRVLRAGEAVYVPAGVVHAYIRGTGVEVMTASDNVLRLGLTPKTVAVDSALGAVAEDLAPVALRPDPVELPGGGSVLEYAPATAPFRVRWLREGELDCGPGRYRLILGFEGRATVRCGDSVAELEPGQAAVALASEPAATVTAAGSVFIAEPA